ncbi:MAG: C39 family peptidase [Pseudomonadales bacterium]|nr:C39 family peptidase [Pseudomonadales bacterium]
MIKKISITIIFSVFVLILGTKISIVFAQACEDKICNEEDDSYTSCLNEKIACIENRLGEINNQKATLNSTISVINGSINIQELKIRQTVSEIAQLEKEIEALGDRISGLSISLDRLTTLLVNRIRTQYKQQQTDPLAILLTSETLTKLINQYRYTTLAGKQTAKAMQRAQNQKIIYDEQKDLKTIKQDEIETKRYQLQLEQNNLINQRNQKNEILAITKNDEQRFQDLLKEAETQLSSFKRFVSFQGGASILSGQTSCDDWGCYYNQRDSNWGNQLIGNSNSSMSEYGCLVTSMAMIASHYGRSLDPGQIAANNSPFWLNTAYMKQSSWSVNGVTMNRTRVGYNSSQLDNELSSGNPVIVGIGTGPDHFLVIRSKQDNKYIMRDPFTESGKDIPFTDKYSLNSISTIDRVSVN